MSVRISHPVPNIYQSTIGDLKKLSDSKNKLRSYFLAQKITRQQNLGNLEDIYKPLLTNQNKQLDEAKLSNNKLDESKNELTNILQQLVVNGDLSTAALNKIVAKLDKLDKGVLTKILCVVKNRPEAIALLRTLSKYPNVVNAIKYGNITYLNSDIDKKIFNTLEYIDQDILKVLVDYYSNVSENDDLFRLDSRASSQLINEEEATKLDDPLFSDSGIAPTSNISKSEGSIEDINKIAAINEEGNKIYDAINNINNRKLKKCIIDTINGDHTVNFKNKYDESKSLKMKGKELLINYLIKNYITPDKRYYPWLIIKENTNFFDELNTKKKCTFGFWD